MSIAFFDLDLTLISVNSATLWVQRELREGSLSRWQVAKAAAWLGAYRLGFSAMEPVIRDAVASLAGVEEAVIARRTLAFWEQEVRQTERPGAREVLAAHRAKGESLVLLTGSSRYLAALAAAHFGLDGYLANGFEVAEGRFTGRAEEPLCYGPGKVDHAQAWAETRGVPLADCAFYTDSFSDLAALERVGRPVAVHPDPRLLRVARQRSWPVLSWGPAGKMRRSAP